MACEVRCDGQDLFAILLEAGFTEAFDGEEFFLCMRDQGGDCHEGALVHDGVSRDVILLEPV